MATVKRVSIGFKGGQVLPRLRICRLYSHVAYSRLPHCVQISCTLSL